MAKKHKAACVYCAHRNALGVCLPLTSMAKVEFKRDDDGRLDPNDITVLISVEPPDDFFCARFLAKAT